MSDRVWESVWDCFVVNDELDLLSLRLRHLDGVVDRFVVIEADRTFTGQPKALLASAWLAAGHAAGITTPVETVTVAMADLDGVTDAALREGRQKSAFADVARRAGPSVLVLMGDLDELPYRDVVRSLRTGPAHTSRRLAMRQSILSLDLDSESVWLDGTVAADCTMLDTPAVRRLVGLTKEPPPPGTEVVVREAGRHLTFLGGPERVAAKLSSYVHTEQAYLGDDLDHVRRCIRYGTHLAGQDRMRRTPVNRFDEVARAALEVCPDYLVAGAGRGGRLTSRAMGAWARRRGRLPVAVRRRIDRLPVVRWSAALALLLLETARRAVRPGRGSR